MFSPAHSESSNLPGAIDRTVAGTEEPASGANLKKAGSVASSRSTHSHLGSLQGKPTDEVEKNAAVTRAPLVDLAASAVGSSSNMGTAATSQTGTVVNEILKSRKEMLSAINRFVGNDADLKQLKQFHETGEIPAHGEVAKFIKAQLATSAATNQKIGDASSHSPEQSLAVMQESLHEALGQMELQLPRDSEGNPIKATPDEEAAAADTVAFILGTPAILTPAVEQGALETVSNPIATTQSHSSATGGEIDPHRLSSEIQQVATSLLVDPATATAAERSSAVGLALMQRSGVPNADRAVQLARLTADGCRAINSGASTVMGAIGTMIKSTGKAMSAVAANEFENPLAVLGASVANVGTRNGLGVYATTVARQMGSAQIQAGLDYANVSNYHRAVLGGTSMLLPALLLMAGSARDHGHKTATSNSDIARAMMGSLVLGFMLAGLFENQLGGSAAQLVAFNLYTLARDDGVQSHIRLNNPNTAGKAPDKTHWAIISVLYAIDQFAVNLLMSILAPISGPSAAHLPLKEQFKAANIRGTINYMGEVAEDLMFNGIAAVRDNKMLRLGLSWVPNATHLANATLANHPVRAAITQTNVMIYDLIGNSRFGAANPVAANYLSAGMAGGMLNGIYYWPFANAGSGQLQPHTEAITDVETGSQHSQEVHTFALPNVDLTDRATLSQHHDDTELSVNRLSLGEGPTRSAFIEEIPDDPAGTARIGAPAPSAA
jgi:hypothetical protein